MALKIRALRASRTRAVRVEAKQWSSKGGVLIPPAWNKRVVVPEVEPRKSIAPELLADAVPRRSCGATNQAWRR
jgi:hypothetical protein